MKMMHLTKRLLMLSVLIFSMSFMMAPARKIKIWMIGDSTMCMYGPERAPLTGWGMPFATFFDSTVQTDNRARGGRSTRTFISENRWQPVSDSMQEGDYVLIQFGHNDEAKEEKYKDRYTTPEDYRKNLIRFITETKNKKAFPVLITPVSRMRFNKEGKAEETHVEYSAIVVDVAKEQNVPIIDLDKESRELYQKLGPEATKLLFMQLEPGEHPFYPDGSKDNTHFNELGARRMAEIVLANIRSQNLELAKRIVVRTTAK
jgi:lysophospholipase L1-like esterase